MRILHTESSTGWGGQETRILKEAEGLRDRGHEVIMAVAAGGGLVAKAKQKGFLVYELSFEKPSIVKTLIQLQKIIRDRSIDIVNTHSSWDAWAGGIAARLAGKKVVRTRHLSTPIRKGLNSKLLYNGLADFVVTTSSCIVPVIHEQSNISADRIRCIPTGVDPSIVYASDAEVEKFRGLLLKDSGQILVGTACFVRSWKGVRDLMQAAKLLKEKTLDVRWVVIGGGYYKDYMAEAGRLGIGDVFTFTGHLESPFAAIKALDIFTLVSTAHEGVSQASLQAAYLERPLITTNVGGLPEICIPNETGLIVPVSSPEKIVEAILELSKNPALRQKMGQNGKKLVEEKFTFQLTLDGMEEVYDSLLPELANL